MTTNVFFNNYEATGEQRLIEDLIVESIRIYGQEVYYIPRTTVDLDEILNEDALREYDRAILIEMYIKNIEGFGGQGDFLSKFSIEINDSITFTVARKSFTEDISGVVPAIIRPREGDLVYFPLNGKIFEIKFVEHEAIFYQIGSLQTYDIRCELFEYSNEVFHTGVASIDRIMQYSFDQNTAGILTENGLLLTTEAGNVILREEFSIRQRDAEADNLEIQTESDEIVVFDEQDPFAEGAY